LFVFLEHENRSNAIRKICMRYCPLGGGERPPKGPPINGC
jgi:hypothetical protein